MENDTTINQERKISDYALFWTIMLATLAVGLALVYSSGILNGVQGLQRPPFVVPDGLIFALPPVVFVHFGLSLFLALRQPHYTQGAKRIRNWTCVFWVMLFITHVLIPFFTFHGVEVGAYVAATLASGLAIGTTILMYQNAVSAGIISTILCAVTIVITVFLGAWIF